MWCLHVESSECHLHWSACRFGAAKCHCLLSFLSCCFQAQHDQAAGSVDGKRTPINLMEWQPTLSIPLVDKGMFSVRILWCYLGGFCLAWYDKWSFKWVRTIAWRLMALCMEVLSVFWQSMCATEGQARTWLSVWRWKMRPEEWFFIVLHEECLGAVVALCFISLPE